MNARDKEKRLARNTNVEGERDLSCSLSSCPFIEEDKVLEKITGFREESTRLVKQKLSMMIVI